MIVRDYSSTLLQKCSTNCSHCIRLLQDGKKKMESGLYVGFDGKGINLPNDIDDFT